MSDITIRNATLADAPRILEIYAYYVEHTVITFEYDVPSLAEFEGRMRDIMKKYPYLVIERDGRIEGYAYAHAFAGPDGRGGSQRHLLYARCGLQRPRDEAPGDRGAPHNDSFTNFSTLAGAFLTSSFSCHRIFFSPDLPT